MLFSWYSIASLRASSRNQDHAEIAGRKIKSQWKAQFGNGHLFVFEFGKGNPSAGHGVFEN